MNRRDFMVGLGSLAGIAAAKPSEALGVLGGKTPGTMPGFSYRVVDGVKFTAYTVGCGPGMGYTASGRPYSELRTYAADPDFYKMGTTIYNPWTDTESQQFRELPPIVKDYILSEKRRHKADGFGKILDTGSAIKGPRTVDVPINDRTVALHFGKRHGPLYVFDRPLITPLEFDETEVYS